MHFTEYDTRLAAYALLVNDRDEILLTWFNGNAMGGPSWTMPGGEVNFDESIVDAVLREVYEETGYRVAVGLILAEHHVTGRREENSRPYRSQRFLVAASITGGQLGTTEIGGSTDFAQWVPIDEVDQLEPRARIVDVALAVIAADNLRR